MQHDHEHHVPVSINTELKEHTRLFERKIHRVGENVYCAVGYNLANIIMVEGKDGVHIDIAVFICYARSGGNNQWGHR